MLVSVADLFFLLSDLFARFVFLARRARASFLRSRLVVPVTSSYSSITTRRVSP
jgi:hypothetical protein